MKIYNSQKSQITVFIIIGIIILFAVALLFYVKSSTSKIRPPVEKLEVSDEAKPVQTYITDCLHTISKNALIQIGSAGGYFS